MSDVSWTFDLALGALKAGQRIARRAWKQQMHIYLSRDGRIATDFGGYEWRPSALSECLLADDWYVIDD